ncbi:MAG: aldo/keto reductase [Bifidobacteriaceae bacterium]|jgi:aryl-alcohol dehydrogenase-like predicted oxidoreductase|nr:aldo/keto reductase [Bifidobacteriaceae bacterium]
MEYRTLGNSQLQVSVLSLGSAHIYDRLTMDEVVALLQAAIAAGINWFDVGYYTSETNPERPVSTTDFRFARGIELAGIKREQYYQTSKLWYGGKRPTFKAQLAQALPRANTDYADVAIYNPATAHHYGQKVDMKAITEQMAGLVADGWIRQWGINHAWPSEIREACEFAVKEGMPLPCCMQVPYSAVAREMMEDPDLLEVSNDFDLAFQVSNPLAVGVLAGRPRAQATRHLGQAPLAAHAEAILPQLTALAESVGATKAQLVLAFATTYPRTASVLFGCRGTAQLEEDLGALDLLARLGADGVRDLLKDLPQNPEQAKVDESWEA